MQQEPLDENAPYDDVAAALLASERAISEVFFEHFKANKPLTHADFFGMGIGRRALALSSAFRLMTEHRNSLCALPMISLAFSKSGHLFRWPSCRILSVWLPLISLRFDFIRLAPRDMNATCEASRLGSTGKKNRDGRASSPGDAYPGRGLFPDARSDKDARRGT
jgi:hypothetical protein